MLSVTWQVAAELCRPIYRADPVGGGRGLVLVSDTFRAVKSGGAHLPHLSASYRMQEENHYGIRLTTKPLCRDNIGNLVFPAPRQPRRSASRCA